VTKGIFSYGIRLETAVAGLLAGLLAELPADLTAGASGAVSSQMSAALVCTKAAQHEKAKMAPVAAVRPLLIAFPRKSDVMELGLEQPRRSAWQAR